MQTEENERCRRAFLVLQNVINNISFILLRAMHPAKAQSSSSEYAWNAFLAFWKVWLCQQYIHSRSVRFYKETTWPHFRAECIFGWCVSYVVGRIIYCLGCSVIHTEILLNHKGPCSLRQWILLWMLYVKRLPRDLSWSTHHEVTLGSTHTVLWLAMEDSLFCCALGLYCLPSYLIILCMYSLLRDNSEFSLISYNIQAKKDKFLSCHIDDMVSVKNLIFSSKCTCRLEGADSKFWGHSANAALLEYCFARIIICYRWLTFYIPQGRSEELFAI